MAASMAVRASAETYPPLSTRLTVPRETPAAAATSCTVARRAFLVPLTANTVRPVPRRMPRAGLSGPRTSPHEQPAQVPPGPLRPGRRRLAVERILGGA